MAPAEHLRVEVAYCPGPGPGSCDRVPLLLRPGATVADALRLSGLLDKHGLDPDVVKAGVWSRLREAHTLLRDRDRVEIYRPLVVDPKEARRQRYKRHRQGGGREAPAAADAAVAGLDG